MTVSEPDWHNNPWDHIAPTREDIEQWLRRKYVVRRNRGIDYMEAAVDDLAKEIHRYIHANL